MNEVIGDVIPLAVGIAISPIPIIAAILMLLSPQAKGTSVAFPARFSSQSRYRRSPFQ